MPIKFIRLLNIIREHLESDPYSSDSQIQEYRKLLSYSNSKDAQDTAMSDLERQCILHKKRGLGETQ